MAPPMDASTNAIRLPNCSRSPGGAGGAGEFSFRITSFLSRRSRELLPDRAAHTCMMFCPARAAPGDAVPWTPAIFLQKNRVKTSFRLRAGQKGLTSQGGQVSKPLQQLKASGEVPQRGNRPFINQFHALILIAGLVDIIQRVDDAIQMVICVHPA